MTGMLIGIFVPVGLALLFGAVLLLRKYRRNYVAQQTKKWEGSRLPDLQPPPTPGRMRSMMFGADAWDARARGTDAYSGAGSPSATHFRPPKVDTYESSRQTTQLNADNRVSMAYGGMSDEGHSDAGHTDSEGHGEIGTVNSLFHSESPLQAQDEPALVESRPTTLLEPLRMPADVPPLPQ